MVDETFRDSCIGCGGVGRTREEGTSMDEIRHLLTRNRTSRVFWNDAIPVVPVTWDLGVPDPINLLRVFDVPEDEVRAGFNPNSANVGTRRNFDKGWRFLAELRCPATECVCLRTWIRRSNVGDLLVSNPQDCSQYPDENSLLDSELRVQPTPREDPYGEPERQTEEEGRDYLVGGIHKPPWLGPAGVKTVER